MLTHVCWVFGLMGKQHIQWDLNKGNIGIRSLASIKTEIHRHFKHPYIQKHRKVSVFQPWTLPLWNGANNLWVRA